jgi:CrcB protein
MGWVAAFVGGGIGSVLRMGIGRWTLLQWGTGFPWGTLIVNVVGSFLIGLLAARLAAFEVDHAARLFLVTGLLGGFTTFSAFSLDAMALWQRGQAGTAAAYVLSTLILSLAAAPLGFLAGR